MTAIDPPPPDRHRDYEDFAVGAVIPFGRMTVTADDIVKYARAFDPQPFHLSEEAARDSNVGRLIASGYHTCCMLMRMAADDLLGGPGAIGSPGVEDVRFLKPVLPGDELSGRCTTLDKRPLRSRPGIGLVHCQLELLNGRSEAVISWDVYVFRRMRNGSSNGSAA